jgi:hypothetical protein
MCGVGAVVSHAPPGAVDDFLGRGCGGLNVFAEIAA